MWDSGQSPYFVADDANDITQYGYSDGYALWSKLLIGDSNFPQSSTRPSELIQDEAASLFNPKHSTVSNTGEKEEKESDSEEEYVREKQSSESAVVDEGRGVGGYDFMAEMCLSDDSTTTTTTSPNINEKKKDTGEDGDERVVHLRQLLQPSGAEEEERFKVYVKALRESEAQEIPFSIWNERFQALVGQPDSEEKFLELAQLAQDIHFQHAATVYGRIIISEQCLPASEKTIKPVNIGGIAGGDKYITRGILFKYAMDKQVQQKVWMYGGHYPSHANAMKSAGHELRSHARVLEYGASSVGILCPFMVLIDYRGFRLVATSVIPVNESTLIYGSSDAGKTVHKDFAICDTKLDALFALMNLKPHMVGSKLLGACGDIEGHLGLDGKFYLLDFARLYPPESMQVQAQYFPLADSRSVFYKVLRPELVAQNAVPLCSDAFTGWLSRDPDYAQHNKEVTEATRRLYEQEVVHIFSSEVLPLNMLRTGQHVPLSDVHANKKKATAKECGVTVPLLNEDLHQILHKMHRSGVNVRCLGVLRHHVCKTDSDMLIYKGILYTEMAARVCKNIIRALLRETVRHSTVPSSAPEKEIVLALFNMFSGYSTLANRFWSSTEIPSVEGCPPSSLAGDLEFYIYHAACLVASNKEKGVVYTRKEEINFLLSRLLPMKQSIKAKFGNMALTQEEWDSKDRKKPFLFQGLLFMRICDMMAIDIDEQPAIFDILNGDPPMPIPEPYEFMAPHLLDLKAKVKEMHLTAACEGYALWRQCAVLEEHYSERRNFLTSADIKKLLRLLKFALSKLELAIQLVSDSVQTLVHLGNVQRLLGVYWPSEDYAMKRGYFESALNNISQAITLTPKDKDETISPLIQSAMQRIEVMCDWSVAFPEEELKGGMLGGVAIAGRGRNARRKGMCKNWRLWNSAWKYLWELLITYTDRLDTQWTIDLQHISTAIQEGIALRAGQVISAIMKHLALWRLRDHEALCGPWKNRTFAPNHQTNDRDDESLSREEEMGKGKGKRLEGIPIGEEVFIRGRDGRYIASTQVEGVGGVRMDPVMSVRGVWLLEEAGHHMVTIRHVYSGKYLCCSIKEQQQQQGGKGSLSPSSSSILPLSLHTFTELVTQNEQELRLWYCTINSNKELSFKGVNGRWLGVHKDDIVTSTTKANDLFELYMVDEYRVYLRNPFGFYLHCGDGEDSITSYETYNYMDTQGKVHLSATLRVPASMGCVFFLEKATMAPSISLSLPLPLSSHPHSISFPLSLSLPRPPSPSTHTLSFPLPIPPSISKLFQTSQQQQQQQEEEKEKEKKKEKGKEKKKKKEKEREKEKVKEKEKERGGMMMVMTLRGWDGRYVARMDEEDDDDALTLHPTEPVLWSINSSSSTPSEKHKKEKGGGVMFRSYSNKGEERCLYSSSDGLVFMAPSMDMENSNSNSNSNVVRRNKLEVAVEYSAFSTLSVAEMRSSEWYIIDSNSNSNSTIKHHRDHSRELYGLYGVLENEEARDRKERMITQLLAIQTPKQDYWLLVEKEEEEIKYI